MRRLIVSFVISLAVIAGLAYNSYAGETPHSAPSASTSAGASASTASPSPTRHSPSPSTTKSSPKATFRTSYEEDDVYDLPDTDAPTATADGNGTDCAFLEQLIESQKDSNAELEEQINSGNLSAGVLQQYKSALDDGEDTLAELQDQYDDAGC